jgi:hypothetical protein
MGEQQARPTNDEIFAWIGKQSGITVAKQETGKWRVDGDDTVGESRDLREAFAGAMVPPDESPK